MHNTIDSCILQLVTSATCFVLAWPSSGLQGLVSIKVRNVAVPMGSHGVQCIHTHRVKPFPLPPFAWMLQVHNLLNNIILLRHILTINQFQYNKQRRCKPWDPIGTATLCTLIHTILCKPDDGQARPKHVADVTSCRIQMSTVLCKEGLMQKKTYEIC